MKFGLSMFPTDPQDRGLLERCRDAGLHRVVFLIQPEPRGAALRALDARVPLTR
jgi:hypothetical protein